jgi:ribonuclease HII
LDKILSSLVDFDRNYIGSSSFKLCGVDEAGRGPIAGPVVAAAVVLDYNNLPTFLNDSKKLTEKQRTIAFHEIRKRAIEYGVSIISHKRVDEINILQANFEAMNRAVKKLKSPPNLVLVDGRDAPIKGVDQKAIVKGDMRSAAISAASIIAKVVRDLLMVRYDKIYPEYGFKSHKGYGTKRHIDIVKRIGRSPIHRESFRLKFELDEQLTLDL